jgi:hypothetical protein
MHQVRRDAMPRVAVGTELEMDDDRSGQGRVRACVRLAFAEIWLNGPREDETTHAFQAVLCAYFIYILPPCTFYNHTNSLVLAVLCLD